MIATRHLPILMAVVLGALASAGLLLLSQSWERRIQTIDFQNRARNHVATIDTDLQDAASVIETVRVLFEASDRPVGREEFMRFSKALHGRTAGLRDLGWAPRVTEPDRDAFVQQVRATGLPSFELLERAPTGGMQRADPRPEHFPILYLDSGSTVQPVFGFDLGSEPTRQAAIERAMLARPTAATPPIRLLTVPRERGGMMGFAATGQQASSATTGASGVVFGAFDNAEMIENIISTKRHLSGIELYVFDPSGTPGDRLIHWSPNPAHPRPAPPESELRAQTHWEGAVSMLDRKWGVIFVPDAVASTWSWRLVLAPAAGVLLTILGAGYLLVTQRRTARLVLLTTSLRETTEGLHRQAEKITHMAHHDVLTGLSNRRMFSEQLRQAVEHGNRENGCAVLLMDLDRFKPVNDAHGHDVGDAVLCEVARRLAAAAGPGDKIARLGGDEFAAIVEGAGSASGSAELARRIVDAMKDPIQVGDLAIDVGITIGIARAPADGTAPAAVMRAADLAMYRAKRQERGTVRYYEPAMDEELRAETPKDRPRRQPKPPGRAPTPFSLDATG